MVEYVVCFVLLFLVVLPLITEGKFVGWKDAAKAFLWASAAYGTLVGIGKFI